MRYLSRSEPVPLAPSCCSPRQEVGFEDIRSIVLIGTNTLSRWKVRWVGKVLSPFAPTVGLSLEMPHPKSTIDRGLPWLIGLAAIAMVLVTVLSGRTPHLPGIALESKPLFLIERGGAALMVLIVIVTVLSRGLKGELPTGFSALGSSVRYAETVAEATKSSENAAAELVERLDKHDAALAEQDERLDDLAQRIVAIPALVSFKQPPDPPGR
jgi:hypothetical protein